VYELALFAGAGGGILGGILCGHTIVGAVEIEEYPREVLKQRQRDGLLDRFPIWDDVTTFRIDNPECKEYIEALRGIRDELVISGGFPCQDISSAGKGAGIAEGTRSGLWFEFSRIISEIQPSRVFVENSPLLVSRGLDIVLGDLAEMGYDAKWGIIGARHVGAIHKRDRLWVLSSNTNKVGRRRRRADYEARQQSRHEFEGLLECEASMAIRSGEIGRMADDVSNRMDRLKAIGNGQVPAVVNLAWQLLT